MPLLNPAEGQGRISAAAVAKIPTAREPAISVVLRSRVATASASISSIRSACRTSALPASVSSSRRPTLRSRGTPAALSRALSCCDTAPGV